MAIGLTDEELDALEVKPKLGLTDEELDRLAVTVKPRLSKGLTDSELNKLAKTPPTSQVIPPKEAAPLSLTMVSPTAQEPPIETAIVPSREGLTIFTPSEQEIRNILSYVSPSEREKAKEVLTKTVQNREDLNVLQGRLTALGEKYLGKIGGFGAGLIEDFLNPLSIPEVALFNSGVSLFKSSSRKRFLDAIPQFSDDILRVMGDTPVETPITIATRKELRVKSQKITDQLFLPDEIGNATPLDPLGGLKKRLALPDEEGVEIVFLDRITPTDPMGVLLPKGIRVVPISQSIPDNILIAVSPDGARSLALGQNNVINTLVKNISVTSIVKKLSGRSSKKNHAKKVEDLVNSKVIQSGEDMALYSNAKSEIITYVEDFGSPESILEKIHNVPFTDFQRGVKMIQAVYNLGVDMSLEKQI